MAKSNSKGMVPEALDRFKMEAASEVGVNLKQGYNGHLTSREAGSVGGQMVKDIFSVRTFRFLRNYRWLGGHSKEFFYEVSLAV